MLFVKNVFKSYGKQEVLKGVNLEVKAGEMYGLIGKNGSGKSTLMRLMAQRELMNSGDIVFKGESIRSTKINLNPSMLYVCEDQNLPAPISISEWSQVFKSMYKKFDIDKWGFLVKEFGVDLTKSFSQLSRGQRMKALFAL